MSKTKFAQQYAKLLAKTPCNKAILTDEDAWLRPFLEQSPLYSRKISRAGTVIKAVAREFGPKRQKFLAIVEPNGTEQIVAKGKLIASLWPSEPKPKSQKLAVLAIMRASVAGQIAEFRSAIKLQIKALAKAGFADRAKALNSCKLTGRSLNTCRTAVDHATPFLKLAEDWLELNGLVYDTIRIKGRGKNASFADEALLLSWQAYHKAEAKLQMTCASANSSANSRGYKSRF